MPARQRRTALPLALVTALLALVLGSGWMQPATAAVPSVSIVSPTPGSVFPDGRVKIEGRYSSSQRVTGVTLAVCRPSGPTTCRDYLLARSNGAFSKVWHGIPATLTPSSSDGRTGTFAVVLTGLPSTPLRLAAYGTDADTPKGPRALVDFVAKAMDRASFVTILFGRANWVATGGQGCTIRPGEARTLEQNAIDLASRGLIGVAQVVTTRVAENTHLCPDNFALESSWADLARLRDTYGWTLTSQSKTYPNMTQLPTVDDILDESAGTLPIFRAHGHDRAWGAFAYPNNKQDARVQTNVNRFFAFGRVYAADVNPRTVSTTAPYPMRTMSVNGGRCHNPALACYTMPVQNDRRTTPPQVVARHLRPGLDHWGVVQFYRIVEGKFGTLGTSFAWDCTGANWEDRWTSQPELYCRNSMLTAFDARNQSATSVDPATVALAWGRIPPRR